MRVATSIRFLLGGNPGSIVDENAVAELPPCIRAYRVDLRATRRRVLGAGPVDVNFDRRWGNVSLVFGTGSQYRTWSRAVAQLGSAPDWGSSGLAAVAGQKMNNGMWRSLVAHLTGGQGVAGSNPVSPTNWSRWGGSHRDFPIVCCCRSDASFPSSL